MPKKEDITLFSKFLGIVIYCASHGDCANGVLKLLESNVMLLAKIVEKPTFTKLVYIIGQKTLLGI